MDSAYLPAFAALAGSAIGGLTSFASAWLTQHHQARADGVSRDKARRQKVYRQFIEEASKLYADALVHDNLQISTLVGAYALISRMRVHRQEVTFRITALSSCDHFAESLPVPGSKPLWDNDVER